MIHIKQGILDSQSDLMIKFDLFFGILGIMTISGKLGTNTLDHRLGNTKSDSVLYFTPNEAIIKCQGYLRIELYQFERVLALIITYLVGG